MNQPRYSTSAKQSTFRILWKILRDKGASYFIKKSFYKLIFPRIFIGRRPETFVFRGESLRYFNHPYNITWANERTVEIPIIKREIDRHPGARILEVGNVLSHYFACEWDIVDKYENAPGVINADVVDYDPDNTYDLIISISD